MNSFREDNRTDGPLRAIHSSLRRRIHRGRSILRHYFVLSSAIALLALMVSIGVSALAVAYADSPPRPVDEVSALSVQAEISTSFQEVASSAEDASFSSLLAPTPSVSPAAQVPARSLVNVLGSVKNVNITYYDCAGQGFCGTMAGGRRVYQGAAACSYNLPLGTRFLITGDPTGRVYTCEDRGLLANTWVDIFFYYPSHGQLWQSIVGRYGTIEIVYVPR